MARRHCASSHSACVASELLAYLLALAARRRKGRRSSARGGDGDAGDDDGDAAKLALVEAPKLGAAATHV